MARRIISLRYPAKCSDCGAALPAGAQARYYGPGRVYGTECHVSHMDGKQPRVSREDRARQLLHDSTAAWNRTHNPVAPIDTNTLANAGVVVDLATARRHLPRTPDDRAVVRQVVDDVLAAESPRWLDRDVPDDCHLEDDGVITPDFDDGELPL